jgi:hypothetical protein
MDVPESDESTADTEIYDAVPDPPLVVCGGIMMSVDQLIAVRMAESERMAGEYTEPHSLVMRVMGSCDVCGPVESVSQIVPWNGDHRIGWVVCEKNDCYTKAKKWRYSHMPKSGDCVLQDFFTKELLESPMVIHRSSGEIVTVRVLASMVHSECWGHISKTHDVICFLMRIDEHGMEKHVPLEKLIEWNPAVFGPSYTKNIDPSCTMDSEGIKYFESYIIAAYTKASALIVPDVPAALPAPTLLEDVTVT